MNQEAGICEWIAPKRPPAPTTERKTSGTLTCSRVRNQYFVAWLTTRVHREREEVAEHDLDDRPQPVHRRAERGAGERELRDGRVEDALRAVLLVQAGRRGEDAAGDGDVLAEEDHALVDGELLVERVADRGAEGDRRHQRARTSGRSSSSQRRDRKRAPSAP